MRKDLKLKASSFSESRVGRSREEVKAAYDGMSRFYDLFLHLFEGRYVNLGLRSLNPQRGERILEIGSGTGRGLCFLAERVGRGSGVYDLDLSEKMVRVARARLRARGFAGEVVVECGDAGRLPYETDFFDAIFMSFTLELFDTPEIPLISTSV